MWILWWSTGLTTNLEIPVDQVINLKVFFIVAPRIEQRFGNFDPTHVSDKLEYPKNRNVDVRGVSQEGLAGWEGDVQAWEGAIVNVSGVGLKELVRKHWHEEVGVDGQGCNLSVG